MLIVFFNKFGELQTLISEKKYDSIAITEIFPETVSSPISFVSFISGTCSMFMM
jgi:hypothetical protein